MSVREPRIDLVPWDYDSPAHVERMYIQRLACGWRSEEVHTKWVELSRAKKKTLYWVVLRDELPDKEDILRRHLAENPQQSVPIHDTAPTHWHLPRQLSGRPFTPIGHIALDLRPEQDATLLPALRRSAVAAEDEDGINTTTNNDKIVWVAGLFISHALQAGGLGLEVMRAAETLAARADLLAGDWIVLDTMPREQQMNGDFVRLIYTAQGMPVPAVAIQDWYERQGYVVFAEEKGGYKWANPVTGDRQDIDYLFLRKRLSR